MSSPKKRKLNDEGTHTLTRTHKWTHVILRATPYFRQCLCCGKNLNFGSFVMGKWENRHRTMGQNQVVLRHLIIHFSTSLGASEQASEWKKKWAQQITQTNQAVRSKNCEASSTEQAYVLACERTSERPSIYVCVTILPASPPAPLLSGQHQIITTCELCIPHRRLFHQLMPTPFYTLIGSPLRLPVFSFGKTHQTTLSSSVPNRFNISFSPTEPPFILHTCLTYTDLYGTGWPNV